MLLLNENITFFIIITISFSEKTISENKIMKETVKTLIVLPQILLSLLKLLIVKLNATIKPISVNKRLKVKTVAK